MTETTNYDLILVEGTDKVNPLTQVNPNFEKLDTELKKIDDSAITTATELKTGTVHALSRSNTDCAVMRFTATSNYTAGDTFTVDGVQVTALTPSGEALGDGSYIIGSEVMCSLKGTLLTMFLTGGAVTVADNALKLGGQEPDYYGTAEAVVQAQQTASAAGVLANSVQTQVNDLSDRIVGLVKSPNFSAKIDLDVRFSTYTATSNGTFYGSYQTNANGRRLLVKVNGVELFRAQGETGEYYPVTINLSEGDELSCEYENTNSSWNKASFIPNTK